MTMWWGPETPRQSKDEVSKASKRKQPTTAVEPKASEALSEGEAEIMQMLGPIPTTHSRLRTSEAYAGDSSGKSTAIPTSQTLHWILYEKRSMILVNEPSPEIARR